MLKLILIASLKLSRVSPDMYVSDDGTTAVATKGCTQNARNMEAKVESYRGRLVVVFYDNHGEEEADCDVVVVVRKR